MHKVLETSRHRAALALACGFFMLGIAPHVAYTPPPGWRLANDVPSNPTTLALSAAYGFDVALPERWVRADHSMIVFSAGPSLPSAQAGIEQSIRRSHLGGPYVLQGLRVAELRGCSGVAWLAGYSDRLRDDPSSGIVNHQFLYFYRGNLEMLIGYAYHQGRGPDPAVLKSIRAYCALR